MEIRRSIGNLPALLSAAAVAVGPVLLYVFLLKMRAGDALMYSGGSLVFVVLSSVICACVVWVFLVRPLKKAEAAPLEENDEEEDEYAKAATEECSPGVSFAMEEYPELFRERSEEESKSSSSPAYFDALTKAFNAQKSNGFSEPDERVEDTGDDIFADFFSKKENEEDTCSDIYINLPETLPEGYELRTEDEDFEEELYEESEDEEPFEKKAGFGETVLTKAIAFAIGLVVALAIGFVASLFFTVYSENGFSIVSIGMTKNYTWQDCARYEIAPTLFGDRLSVVMYMKDGEEVKLLPSDLSFSKEFSKEYANVYEYAAQACSAMESAGAEKTVRERNTIEGEFFENESVSEYVKAMID